MLTREETAALAVPDPDQTALLQKAGPPPPLDWSDMEKLRAGRAMMYKAMVTALGPSEPHSVESYTQIAMRDGYSATAKIWTPSQPAPGGSPLVILFYGGGFVFGSCDANTMYARDLCRLFGATVVGPNYRLGPENPFPAAPNDAVDAMAWAAANAAKLGADPAKGFVVGGISAGANLSAAVSCLYAAEDIQPPLTGVWLNVPPVFGKREHVPERYRDLYFSMEQNKDAPVLNEDAIRNMMARYNPDPDSPLYSPTVRGEEMLKKLPPHYFQVCGLDPLRDDGLVYEAMLKDAGVKTLAHMYPGLAHAAWAYLPTLPAADKVRAEFAEGMAFLLGLEQREDAKEGDGWAAAPA